MNQSESYLKLKKKVAQQLENLAQHPVNLKLEKVALQLENLAQHPARFKQDQIDKVRLDIDIYREEWCMEITRRNETNNERERCFSQINKWSEECLARLQDHEDQCNEQVAVYKATRSSKDIKLSIELKEKCFRLKSNEVVEEDNEEDWEDVSDSEEDGILFFLFNEEDWKDVSDSEEDGIERTIQRGEGTINRIQDLLSMNTECIFVPNKDKIDIKDAGFFAIHPKEVLHPNVVHFWPLQGSIGDIVGSRDLVTKAFSKIKYTENRHGVAWSALDFCQFDGDFEIPSGDPFTNTKELTISVWVNRSSKDLELESYVLGIWGSETLRLKNGIHLILSSVVNGKTSPELYYQSEHSESVTPEEEQAVEVEVDKWHHFAITLDHDSLTVYVDGKHVETQENADKEGQLVETLGLNTSLVGCRRMNDIFPNNKLSCLMSDFKMFDKALTKKEIEFEVHTSFKSLLPKS